DLDLTLDRGRVDFTDAKADGPATVRVRFWDQTWKIVLDSPNTRVALELCGRWPPGSRFRPAEPNGDPAKAPAPVASLVLLALVTLGALDDLDALGKSLVAAKTLEQWDFGITVLRHWLGRSRGQDQRYYEILTTVRGYTAEQAKTILQLLFGFSPEDLAQPET